jgi:uncharacterized membrane protein YeaQ/YmgE (transglycosylase-associated protein family)
MDILLFLLLGALAGWIAGKIMKGSGFGLIGNIVVGVIGAFLGGFLFRLVGLASYGFIGSLITAVVGAIVLIWVVNLVKK